MAHERDAPTSPPRRWLELFVILRIERAGPVLVKYGWYWRAVVPMTVACRHPPGGGSRSPGRPARRPLSRLLPERPMTALDAQRKHGIGRVVHREPDGAVDRRALHCVPDLDNMSSDLKLLVVHAQEGVEDERCTLTEVAELRRVRPDAYVQFDTCQDGGYRRYAGSASACDRREEREGVMVEAKETPPGGRQLRSALRKPTPGRHAGAKGCMATVRRATGADAVGRPSRRNAETRRLGRSATRTSVTAKTTRSGRQRTPGRRAHETGPVRPCQRTPSSRRSPRRVDQG